MNNIEKYIDKFLISMIIITSIVFVLDAFTVDFNLNRPRQLLGVLFFIFTLFIFILAKFKFNANYKILVISSYLSLALVMVILESIFLYNHEKTNNELEITMHEYLEKAKQRAKELNIDFDARTPFQVVKDFRKNNIEVFPGIASGGESCRDASFVIDNQPAIILSGISNKMHITRNESGKYFTYISDKYGFNNLNPDYELPIDIMLLGDSYAEGYGVWPKDTIQSTLKELKTNTISVGKAGNGPLLMLASLIEYAKPLKPKNIIWLYTSYDNLSNLETEIRSPILTRYLDVENISQNLISKQKTIDDILIKYFERALSNHSNHMLKNRQLKRNSQKLINKLRRFATFKRTTTHLLSALRGEMYIVDDSIYEAYRLILSKAHKIAKSLNSNIYFVYMPLFTEVEQKKGLNKKVIHIIEELNIPMIDVYNKGFLNHNDPLSLFPLRLGYGHYAAEGYNVIARAIYEEIYQSSNKTWLFEKHGK